MLQLRLGRLSLAVLPAMIPVLLPAMLLVAASPAAAPLFELNGKTYSATDLPASEQQGLFDAQADAYTRTSAVAQQAALNLYFAAEAKKSGKTAAAAEADLLSVPEPTDSQVKEWFEANKARIPPGYSLDKISGEVKQMLREQAKHEKREALLASLKKEHKFALLLPEPVPPVVTIDTAGFPAKGASAGSAKVTIVEFADYQCPHCKHAAPALDAVVKKYAKNVQFVFMDFVIKGEFSQLAAQGAYCAGEQGKFWEFHDAAYDKQAELGNADAATKIATGLKLDDAKFKKCLISDAAKAHVNKSKAEAERLGLTGTPSIFLNGRKVKTFDEAELTKLIEPLI